MDPSNGGTDTGAGEDINSDVSSNDAAGGSDTADPGTHCSTLASDIAALADLATDIAALDDPASDTWDGLVKELLLGCFDGDSSGDIDTAAEVDAIECDVYAALETASQSGYETAFVDLYGFTDGMLWSGDSLGFDQTVRAAVAAAVEACES